MERKTALAALPDDRNGTFILINLTVSIATGDELEQTR